MAPSCLFVCLGLAVVFAAGVQSEDPNCMDLKDKVFKTCGTDLHDITINCNSLPSVASKCIDTVMMNTLCKENSTMEFMKVKRMVYDNFCAPDNKKVLSSDKQCVTTAIHYNGILFGMINSASDGMVDCQKIKMDLDAEIKKSPGDCSKILEQTAKMVTDSSLCKMPSNSAHATFASIAVLLATAMVWWSSTTIF